MNMRDNSIKDSLDARLSGLAAPPDMRERVRRALEEDEEGRRPPAARTGRRLGRTLLIAAVFATALAVTAVAVYQYSLRDAVMESVPYTTFDGEGNTVIRPADALSLNHFSDSPEYQAYEEWAAYQAQWQADHPNIYAELGVDDSYYETADNYAFLYGARFREQAEKLDEIMAKYGLTPHTERITFTTEEQLCHALDIDDLIDGEQYAVAGEYLFDDGTFKAVGTVSGLAGWFEIFTAVDGSFTLISQSAPDAVERLYTTASGTEVIMAEDGGLDRTYVIAGLEGCYVMAYIDTADSAQAEAFADSIRWEELNARFAGEADRQAASASVTAWTEARAAGDVADGMGEDVEIALAVLGNYAMDPALTEDAVLSETTCHLPQGEGEDDFFAVYHSYQGRGAGIYLSFRTLKPGETALTPFGAPDTSETPCTVNGYEGILTEGELFCVLDFLDTDRELVFTVETNSDFTAEDTLALAESITATDPSLETGSEAFSVRAAQYEDEIAAITARQEAEEAAWAAAYRAEEEALLQSAQERLGDFCLTAEGFTCTDAQAGQRRDFTAEGTFHQYVYRSYQRGGGNFDLYYAAEWELEDESSYMTENEYLQFRADYEETVTIAGGASYIRDITIHGCEGYISYVEDGLAQYGMDEYRVSWLDRDTGLMFSLSYSGGGEAPSPEALIALAEGVTETE